jgi:general stress protein 26
MPSINDPLARQLLNARHIASFATENPDRTIHMVAVWFLFAGGPAHARTTPDDDNARIYLATSTRTRKARNIEANPKVTLMIDSRDAASSCGITIYGNAQMLSGEASRHWNEQVHRKYLSAGALHDPKVGPVFAAFDDLTIEITPRSIIAWDMREMDRQAFSGSFEKNPDYLLPVAP